MYRRRSLKLIYSRAIRTSSLVRIRQSIRHSLCMATSCDKHHQYQHHRGFCLRASQHGIVIVRLIFIITEVPRDTILLWKPL